MIQKIGVNLNFRNNTINKNNANIQNSGTTLPQDLNPSKTVKPAADLLQSYYVSFGGKRKNNSSKTK